MIKVNICVDLNEKFFQEFQIMEDLTLNEFKARLAKKIRLRRKELNLTQGDLAEKLGNKDKQTVNRYELDGANPTIFNFIKLAIALELTLDQLLDFSEIDNVNEPK